MWVVGGTVAPFCLALPQLMLAFLAAGMSVTALAVGTALAGAVTNLGLALSVCLLRKRHCAVADRDEFCRKCLLLLAACGADNIWASDESLRRAAYVANEPPSITLLTVIGIPRGEGAHSALMINGSQRVIFDPAGSWNHPAIPERHDVLYGITPNFKNFYIDYHARQTYWVAEDTKLVSREVADAAIRAASLPWPNQASLSARVTTDPTMMRAGLSTPSASSGN